MWGIYSVILLLFYLEDTQAYRSFVGTRHITAASRQVLTDKTTSTPWSSSTPSPSVDKNVEVVIKDLQFLDIFSVLRLTTQEFFPTCPTLMDKKDLVGNILG